jgi:hypothetical protein
MAERRSVHRRRIAAETRWHQRGELLSDVGDQCLHIMITCSAETPATSHIIDGNSAAEYERIKREGRRPRQALFDPTGNQPSGLRRSTAMAAADVFGASAS